MKKKKPLSQIKTAAKAVLRYTLILFNLSLLIGLGVKSVRMWLYLPMDFPETLRNFPEEPEFLDVSSATHQFWGGLIFETVVFVIGSYLIYELFIKNRSIRTNLIAPFVVVFLLLTAESVNFFLPALDKMRMIEVCQKADLTWNKKNNSCNLMDIERRRIEEIKKSQRAKNKRPTAKKPATRKK